VRQRRQHRGHRCGGRHPPAGGDAERRLERSRQSKGRRLKKNKKLTVPTKMKSFMYLGVLLILNDHGVLAQSVTSVVELELLHVEKQIKHDWIMFLKSQLFECVDEN
jgi:hypothetical protein